MAAVAIDVFLAGVGLAPVRRTLSMNQCGKSLISVKALAL
jgi:hypothetical protein